MNNTQTVENWLFLISQGKVAIVYRQGGQMYKLFDVNFYFYQDLTHQKSLKSVNFWQRYSKNKKLDVFGTPCSAALQVGIVAEVVGLSLQFPVLVYSAPCFLPTLTLVSASCLSGSSRGLHWPLTRSLGWLRETGGQLQLFIDRSH